MSAYEAVGDLVEMLRLVPDDLVPTAHVGSVTPSTTDDLPALVATVAGAVELPLGIGGLDAVRRKAGGWSSSQGGRTKADFQVRIFGADAAAVELITGHVTDVLGNRAHALSHGFLDLDLRAVGATGEVAIDRSGDVAAFARTLEYAGLHEQVTAEDSGPGGVIARIDARAAGEFDEKFHIP